MTQNEKCGYIAIIGRPNVGKSTLLNALIGTKISITTPKPQTTRHQVLGIKTINPDQAIYIDTPGIHRAEGRAMNRYMNRLAASVIPDSDVIIFMIDAKKWTDEDQDVLDKLQFATSPVILLINKIDELKDKKELLPLIDRLKSKFPFRAIIPISAIKDNLTDLETLIMSLLPEGPHLFPDEMITDKNERFQVAEIIREKIVRSLEQELPYATTVSVESLKEENKLIRIHAIIWVERDSQKSIVIGKNGARLKKIGTEARKELEKLFNQKVFLQVWVKVKDQWTDDEEALKRLGYE